MTQCYAGFTLHDTLVSLLGTPRICQCKFSGTRERDQEFSSLQHCVSGEQANRTLSFSVHIHWRKLIH